MQNLYLKDQGKTSLPIDLDYVEQRYNAKYVGDFCIRTKFGWQQDSCAAIFWQETPPVAGYSNYFALVFQMSHIDDKPTLFITSGASAFEKPIVGIVADNGEVVHSRYAHDFRSSTDFSVTIDGGQDYVRLVGDKSMNARQVHIIVDGPNISFKPIEVSQSEVDADSILDEIMSPGFVDQVAKEIANEQG